MATSTAKSDTKKSSGTKATASKASTATKSAAKPKAATKSADKPATAAKTASKTADKSESKTASKPAAKSSSKSESSSKSTSGGSKSASKKSDDSDSKSNTTTDHDEIRAWVEERGGKPATVKGTGKKKSDVGILRIDFPGYSGEDKLEEISWDEFFQKFDEGNLQFLYQTETADGKESRFSRFISK